MRYNTVWCVCVCVCYVCVCVCIARHYGLIYIHRVVHKYIIKWCIYLPNKAFDHWGHCYSARTSLPCAYTCAAMQLKRFALIRRASFNIVVTYIKGILRALDRTYFQSARHCSVFSVLLTIQYARLRLHHCVYCPHRTLYVKCICFDSTQLPLLIIEIRLSYICS